MRANDATRSRAIDPADEFHVELDVVGLDPRQQSKARMTRPEIVDRRAEAHAPVRIDDFANMVGILYPLVLGEFEHQAIGREVAFPGRLQRKLDTGQR